jgi:hypothetical protein
VSKAHLHGPQVNLDGVMYQTHREDPRGDYVQLYRNGAVELAYANLLFRSPLDNTNGESLLPELYEIPLVQQGVPAIFETLAALEVAPPAYLMLSWLVGPGIRIAVERPHNRADFIALPAHLCRISAPPIYLEDFGADPLTVLRPAFDGCGMSSASRTPRRILTRPPDSQAGRLSSRGRRWRKCSVERRGRD